jgi:transposase
MIYLGSQKRLTSFWLGRTCVFCFSRRVNRTARGYIKCRRCGKSKSLKKLRRELGVVLGYIDQRPARQIALELGLADNTVADIYRKIRECLYHQCELEGRRLSGSIEIDEAYFGGRRKGKKGRGAAGKSVVLGLLERDGKVYTRVVSSLTAPALMEIIRSKTRKGSVFYTDTFKSYNSLKQYGKHRRINHAKTLVYRHHNHINGIEGFWSYAKHKLYNYHGVSRANFGLYLKEMEYRFNHRNEDLTQAIIRLYFGYVSE